MSTLKPEPANLLIVGLGEALFDCFPERAILGGAPINFAVHANQLLQPLGGMVTVVSRIGKDDLGRQLLQEVTDQGLGLDYIQQDDRLPTGSVQVTLDATGQPTYEIAADVAWDYLASTKQTNELAARCQAVCFGTLAQRSPTSRQAIQNFLQAAGQALRVFDLNLRQEFFDGNVIEQSLQLANVVKLNQEELQLTCKLLDLDSAAKPGNEIEQAFIVCRTFELDAVALTRGDAGTLLFTRDRCIEGSVGNYPNSANADSVGAGDGCCAAFICGLLLGWPLESVLDLANRVGAFVASQPGATPELPAELIAAAQQYTQSGDRTSNTNF
ncbi:MAG: carbohydrate kinase family protein [Bythopirellula sp.]